ncbi:MAG: class I SAM-dependent methyltransferase [Candidatus Palauibacterales bacterium]|nr:class I SAM-dependent methyltransferase [Candidatus Palauibacterales bacterium]
MTRRPTTSRGAAPAALAAALLALVALPSTVAAQGTDGRGTDGADYPFVPTPPEVVAEMLEMADVSGRDTVYDLGSGDGRIVVTAASRYGAAGLGVELDSSLVAEARQRAAGEGVGDRVRMVRGDLFEVDLAPATVVTLYLLPRTMAKLEAMLFRQLRPGARIVAHDFDMEEWAADSVSQTPGGLGGHATLYLWRVPARVGGTWELSVSGAPAAGERLRLTIDQKFAELRATVTRPGGLRVREARVAGDSVRLEVVADSAADGEATTLAGTVSGARMEGRTAGGAWSGRRVANSDSSLVEWQP